LAPFSIFINFGRLTRILYLSLISVFKTLRSLYCYRAKSLNFEPLAKVFFCGSPSSPRTEKLNNSNLSPFNLSLSKGKLRTFARSSGDKDLLDLVQQKNTKIVTPREIWTILKESVPNGK